MFHETTYLRSYDCGGGNMKSRWWHVRAGMALIMVVLFAPVNVGAAVKSEELFGDWVVRTLENPNGDVSVALTTAAKDAFNGIVVGCKPGQPLDMSVMGKHDRSQPIGIKEMAAPLSVKVMIDKKKIESEWRGMLIPVGFMVSMKEADAFIAKMKGKTIKFDVNDIEASFPLRGFEEGLSRFKEACGTVQVP